MGSLWSKQQDEVGECVDVGKDTDHGGKDSLAKILAFHRMDLRRQRRLLTRMQYQIAQEPKPDLLVVLGSPLQPSSTTPTRKKEEVSHFDDARERSPGRDEQQLQKPCQNDTVIASQVLIRSAVNNTNSGGCDNALHLSPAGEDVHEKEKQKQFPHKTEKKANHGDDGKYVGKDEDNRKIALWLQTVPKPHLPLSSYPLYTLCCV